MVYFNHNKFRKFWKQVFTLCLKKHIFFNASAITFNLVICAIPFTLILISIIGYILSIDAAFDELMRYGQELLPNLGFEAQSGELIEGSVTLEELIVPLIGARRIFGITGLIVLLLFAQGLMHTLKHVIFEVFDFQDRRHPAMEIVYNFFAFGVIGGIFIFFSIAISLLSLFSLESFAVPFTDIILEMGWMADQLTYLIPLIFTPLLFYAIFRYISERRIQPRVALIAALAYTVMFELAKFGVSFYVEYALTAYRYFYQGYSIALLLGVWVFYSAVLFVFTSILGRAYRDIYRKPSAASQNPYTAIS
jgi:YihY family inner membrane protein